MHGIHRAYGFVGFLYATQLAQLENVFYCHCY